MEALWFVANGAFDVGHTRWQCFELELVVVNGQAELGEVVDACGAAGGFACSLDGGEEQSNQDANDGDHDEELDERECLVPSG